MTTTMIGAGIDRVDGPLKVAGAAPYPTDVSYPGMLHAAVVRSVIAAGRITTLDTDEARRAPGVVAVITHLNAPKLYLATPNNIGPPPPPPLQDDRILHYGQYVALVVAESPQQAAAAARLVQVGYQPADPVLDTDDPRGELRRNPFGSDTSRGDVAAGLGSAEVTHEAVYTTPENTNNPLGLFATVAVWDGHRITVHDSTQWTSNERSVIAGALQLPEDAVRVQSPYLGGGFGAGLRVWQHVFLAIIAARTVLRPVKLVLTRPEMFTGIGHRPNTVQRLSIAADREGHLIAIDHESTQTIAMEDENREPVAATSATAYACPNVSTRDLQRRLNIPAPGSMRAPGEAQGNFAIECALDELSYKLGMDPLELRLRNYAEVEPLSGRPWSSKALRECYQVGAERFGWSSRNPVVGSMRDGNSLIGYGLAGVSYAWWQVASQARATISRDGTAYVCSAGSDLGTGTYTVMTQLSAELLGLRTEQVRFGLGDSDMPWSAQAGGSGLTGAMGSAVHSVSRALIQKFLDTVDPDSPLHGCTVDDVTVTDGCIHHRGNPKRGQTYVDILTSHGLDALSAEAEGTPRDPEEAGMARSGAFAARFVEVRIDADLATLRVARVVSAIDGGRILNGKLARSQVIGGTTGGIGQALFEETISDPGTGRIANATFSDYLVAVNADVPDLDITFVGAPDRLHPVGTKGIGEIGLCGMAAAIANAVYHATGKRIRSLPITIDELL